MNPGLKALERRLVNNELTPEDATQLEQVRQIATLRREGATLLECARRVGKTERAVAQFVKRGVYKLFVDYLARLERGNDSKQIQEVVKGAKEAFASFAPDAIDFYRECFQRNPLEDQAEKGIFRDPARAEWATERVSKGLGLTEPEHATRPIVHIGSAIIIGELAVISKDDERAKAQVIDASAEVIKD